MNLIILDTIDKTFKAKLSDEATSQPVWTAHYYDSLETNIEELSSDGEFNSTTLVTLATAPVAGKRRVIKEITVYNADSIAHTVTFLIDNNGTQRIVWRGAITAGGTLTLSGLTSIASGAPGEGIPSGGTTGQYLIKASGNAFDAYWGNLRITQEGAKSSAIDAGSFGEMSLDDDFVFLCVVAGTAGNATWKRFQLHLT